MALSPVFLPGKFYGQRSLAVHGATKSQTQLNMHTKTRGQSALDCGAFTDLSVQQKHLGIYENAGSAPKYVWITAQHSVFLTSS